MYMQDLDKMMNGQKVTYARLLNLIDESMDHNHIYSGGNVDIVFDVYSIVKSLYKPNIINQVGGFRTQEICVQISSHLVGMAAHYRHFFASRLNMYTTFYYVYSDKTSLYNTSLKDDYRKDFYSKRLDRTNSVYGTVSDCIQHSVRMSKSYIDYIPHAYFINSETIDYSYILKALELSENVGNSPLIIVSDDLNYFQYLKNPNYYQLIIRPSSDAVLVNGRTFFKEVLHGVKNKNNRLPEFPIEYISKYYALAGVKYYNLNKIGNYGPLRSVDKLNGFYKDHPYLNGNELDEAFLSENVLGLNERDLELYRINDKLISIDTDPSVIFKDGLRTITDQLVEKIDVKAITEINKTYFKDNPIIFDYLFQGEEYE